jgi:hypothetical protein
MPTTETPFPFVIRKSGTSLTFYISGTSAGTATVGTYTAPAATRFTVIGAYNNAGTIATFWDGLIQNVAVWDEDIGTAGVTAYGAGTHPAQIGTTKLAYYFPLDRTDGPLTPINSPTFSAHTAPVIASGGIIRVGMNGGLVG